MIQTIANNTVTCECAGCGKTFTIETDIDLSKHDVFNDILLRAYNQTRCDICAAKAKKEIEDQRRREYLEELADSLLEREEEAGFPSKFRGLQKPFMRQAAVFFWENRNNSVIVSGKTGTGKTSSALYVLGLMMAKEYIKVKYYTRHTLFAAYTKAKTSNSDSEEAFLERLGWYDYIVIDELVGKKGDAALSDSAQELFFTLVDGVYAGERKARLWILGNFYKGALNGLVSDPEPYKRRIRASFKPALFKFNHDETDVSVSSEIPIN